jgi:hypothetical protein
MRGSASHPQGLAGRPQQHFCRRRNRASGAHPESRPSRRGRRDLCEHLERIGGHGALIIDWLDAAPLDAVPLGQLADRIVAFLRERREDPQALITWRERNRHALPEFWARAPADALGIKQELEKTLAPPDGKPTT